MSQLYIPPNTNTLENSPKQQIRLLLQGAYGTGKTFAALTAPNPIVVNFDNNLGAHSGRSDVIDVPFWSETFVKKYNSGGVRYLCIMNWLNTEAIKLSKEQTLIIDGLTNLNNHYDREAPVPLSVKTGKYDMQAWWGDKWDWNKEFFERLKTLSCDVIVCCHEQIERDSDGDPTGKNRPLIQGSFKDEIGTHFTDIFRQHAITKFKVEDIKTNEKVLLSNYRLKSVDDFIKFQDFFETNTMYVWQLQPDSIANCKTHIKNAPKFTKANWNIFV